MSDSAAGLRGPLRGLKIVEIGAIGPVPFAAMMLSDLGAEIIRVERSASRVGEAISSKPLFGRGRRSIALNLKTDEGLEALLRLVEGADGLMEGFRPGVTERLGFGPEACLERNPRLVYGRMTGWGQDGPMAMMAGHDINYIALSGALHAIGREGQPPTPPLNLVGDFGGGGMLLAYGMLAAFMERVQSGQGQVVDAAMIEGAGLLMTMFFEMVAEGGWKNQRASNLLDSGAPFYDVYVTKDEKYVSFGALEPKFFAELVSRLELTDVDFARQNDPETWPALREKIRVRVLERTRDEWTAALEGSDCCFAPVLDLEEAPLHAHNQARGAFVEVDGVRQPAPAPRFSRTPGGVSRKFALPGEHGRQILAEWGFSEGEVEALHNSGGLLLREE